ncbi:HNH endonuclease [Stappia indica]|uniref:HNH endonuclease n=1 Tax=Stappia indica TaxID=538381 RepID=UPI001CD4B8FA|nr:HNH endonuclease [Stappia indica]MCA1297998.1 HNH endonuclease [Stappia indica]
MTGRSVPEWIGKTPDTAAPARVRLRVFQQAGGKCHVCTRKITASDGWDLDHVKALINGGENRESNLAPICDWCHPPKTKADVATKSKTYRMAAKAAGVKRKRSAFQTNRDGAWKARIGGGVVKR